MMLPCGVCRPRIERPPRASRSASLLRSVSSRRARADPRHRTSARKRTRVPRWSGSSRRRPLRASSNATAEVARTSPTLRARRTKTAFSPSCSSSAVHATPARSTPPRVSTWRRVRNDARRRRRASRAAAHRPIPTRAHFGVRSVAPANASASDGTRAAEAVTPSMAFACGAAREEISRTPHFS